MPQKIGKHLLGRLPNPPKDYRDLKMRQVRSLYEEDDYLADMTVRQIIFSTDFFKNWHGMLQFWRWIKQWIKRNPSDPSPPPAVKSVRWEDDVILDQGDTGHCTAFSGTGLEDSYPNPHVYDSEWAHDFYYYIKTAIDNVDPSDENELEAGSWVRSVGKALKAKGLIASYVFAETENDIKQWVMNHGPVCIGSTWFNSMFDPSPEGRVKIDTKSGVAGGHAYLVVGYDPGTDVYTLVNSWGDGWGDHGFFYVSGADFRKLMQYDGEDFEAMAAADLPAEAIKAA